MRPIHARWSQTAESVRPMLATLVEPPLTDPRLVYEPKYDGIRAIVEIAPATGRPGVRIWSRAGNEKTSQFPSIVRALQQAMAKLRKPMLLDGEIVALDARGRPAGFQRLQGRIHLSEQAEVERSEGTQPVALILFDLLRDGEDDLRPRPLTERRQCLESRLRNRTSATIRLSEQAHGDGRALMARARTEGWEGLIAKDAQAPYQSGRRSPAWRKLKIVHQQEFVIGGWTEPRQTRQHFGALLLGVYEPEPRPADCRLPTVDARLPTADARLPTADARLPTADARLPTVDARLPTVDSRPPTVDARPPTVDSRPPTVDARPPTVDARLPTVDSRPQTADCRLSTADCRLTTADCRLKYVGHTGTGFSGAELARIWKVLEPRATTKSPFSARIQTNERAHWVRPELVAQVRFTEWTDDDKLRHPVYLGLREDKDPKTVVREEYGRQLPNKDTDMKRSAAASVTSGLARVVAQLQSLEDSRKDGTIELPDGSRLNITNPAKPFWPQLKITKGALLRYYATVAPLILPAVADRPLVMKRFPNGIDGAAFYQQRSREERPPAGVRIEQLPPEHEPTSEPDARRLIGGSLITLLYMTQIAAISQDPWFSRVQSPLDADYVALDLDPDDDAPFSRVLDVARWIRDELQSLKVPAVPKTSGSSGLHIYIPLPLGTSYESGMLFCQIVATVIASRHPQVATVERKVKARRRGTIYVDFLQNILGKTLATAYSARASSFAGVSTPLEWKELDDPIDPRDFTITSAPQRFAAVGDLWARLRKAKPANLEAVFKKYARG